VVSRIAITGSSGLIGEALVASLAADGHTVQRVVRDRSAAGVDDVVWDLDGRTIESDKLEGVDAVVHLAAEPIRTGRLTPEYKRKLYDSRRIGTTLLAETLAALTAPPSVLVSASAVGYYGNRGDEVLTEESSRGDDFLAEVCEVYEASTQPAADAGIRVALARTGIVIADGGPLIDKVKVPFKLGVGGKVGSGRQYVPWIALEDEVRALRFLLDTPGLEGPFNLSAPEPVTNLELTKALGDVLRRPTLLPVPPFALRLVYGEIGEMLAMVSTRAVPRRLLEAGFEFRHTELRSALRIAFDKPAAA
jgi:uncharacterized protein